MATFALVPGAWLGGWCWQRVTPLLRAAGHEVYPITLTGLGDRVHLASPEVGLGTHVQDVVNVLAYEDLRDVVLVGHSYAGMVVGGVADRVPERIGHLVYLDAIIPRDGMAVFDVWSPERRAAAEETARREGDGYRWPMPEDMTGLGSLAGLSDADLRWLRAKAAPQPLGTYREPVHLGNPTAAALRTSYVLCTAGREGDPVPEIVRQVCARLGWGLREIATGHWPMLSAPAELAGALAALAVER